MWRFDVRTKTGSSIAASREREARTSTLRWCRQFVQRGRLPPTRARLGTRLGPETSQTRSLMANERCPPPSRHRGADTTSPVSRTCASAAEPCAYVHAWAGHDRRREAAAGEVWLGRPLSARSVGVARRSARQVHRDARRRRNHQTLGRRPSRSRSPRDPLSPAGENGQSAPCVCRSQCSRRPVHPRPFRAGHSSQDGMASASSSPAATVIASLVGDFVRTRSGGHVPGRYLAPFVTGRYWRANVPLPRDVS